MSNIILNLVPVLSVFLITTWLAGECDLGSDGEPNAHERHITIQLDPQ
eukprot:SAG11_NODE_18123_length_499_cov_1.002500_2_plen_47_part_01